MERPSSKSSVKRQSSAESLSRTELTAQRQQGSDQQAKLNMPEQLPIKMSSRTSLAPPMARGDSLSAASSSKAAGDSESAAGGSKAAGDSTSAAGGSRRTAGDSKSAAEDPRPRRSERITPAGVQEVRGKLATLKISKKPEVAQQVPKIERPERKAGVAGPSTAAGSSTTAGPSTAAGPSRAAAAARRSAKPASDVNAKKLVMSAMDELKSRKGVSLVAIDRNIRFKLGAQAKHWRPHVRTYLRKALKTGKLVHVQSRKRKDGKVAKGLQGSFKLAVAAKRNISEKSAKKAVKTKKLAITVKKTQVKPRQSRKLERRHKHRPTQRTQGGKYRK